MHNVQNLVDSCRLKIFINIQVFSEKMGLEAGWNCHISLRSEKQYLSSINQSDRDNEGFSSAEVSGTTSR